MGLDWLTQGCIFLFTFETIALSCNDNLSMYNLRKVTPVAKVAKLYFLVFASTEAPDQFFSII